MYATSTNAVMDKPTIYPSSYQSQFYVEESVFEKLKKNPLLVYCFTGLTGIAGYKLYQIRKDRKAGTTQRLSLQLINTRLVAQGFVIGTLSLTVFYSLGMRIFDKLTKKTKEPFNGTNN